MFTTSTSHRLGVTLDRFSFPIRVGKSRARANASADRAHPDTTQTHRGPSTSALAPPDSDESASDSATTRSSPLSYASDDSEDESDDFVWDVPNPFASPTTADPLEARVRALMQAEIARMRQYERVGPLQTLGHSHSHARVYDGEDENDGDDEGEDEGVPPGPASIAKAYNDMAEAEERATRRAKRDTYRSKSIVALRRDAIAAVHLPSP